MKKKLEDSDFLKNIFETVWVQEVPMLSLGHTWRKNMVDILKNWMDTFESMNSGSPSAVN